MKHADQVVIKKMVGYCDDIADLIAQFGDTLEAFSRQKAYQYAAGMCIMQIGELVGRLSDEVKESSADIPWRMIRGMRNIYAHNYEQTKLSTIWQTLTEDIPALRGNLLELLERE